MLHIPQKTHSPNESGNVRTGKEGMPPCVYGLMMERIGDDESQVAQSLINHAQQVFKLMNTDITGTSIPTVNGATKQSMNKSKSGTLKNRSCSSAWAERVVVIAQATPMSEMGFPKQGENKSLRYSLVSV